MAVVVAVAVVVLKWIVGADESMALVGSCPNQSNPT